MKSYADTIINEDGTIKGYKPEDYSLDKLNSGKILYDLYAKAKEEKLKKAMVLLRNQINEQPRTSDGGFWHKKIYPHQMWLDSIYMASSFLAEYAYRFNDKKLFDEVTDQILTVAKHTYDPKTGLYYHGWDESREQKWSNPETGTSPNFWSRSMGWYMMALVDALDYLPKDQPQRQKIIDILTQLSKSLEKFRDKKTGMWYQVTDKGNEKGNYSQQHYDIVVDRNGTGNFRNIQQTIDSVRAFNPTGTVTIFIKKGFYKEKIEIPTHVCKNIRLCTSATTNTRRQYKGVDSCNGFCN